MSSSHVAVQVKNVSKSYRIVHEEQATTLGESLVKKLRNGRTRSVAETFWALKDIDIEINKGDVVGIIGRNGAGKSTLLKILSRITAPTTGEITIRGRVGSLLEVGTGFHPELTGRENIYLNGAILGMSRKEINTRFDAIVDFSGVEQFLDTPVKRFSSGMYVRLAFSVAAHLDPEVMIVDEVLAVGDSEFQKKCLGKMQDVAKSGRTIIFVSHNMQTVHQLCKKTVLLQAGKVLHVGPTEETVAKYVELQSVNTATVAEEHRPGTGEYRISNVRLEKRDLQSGDPVNLAFTVEHKHGRVPLFHTTFHLCDETETIVLHGDSRLQQFGLKHQETQEASLSFSGVNLKPGSYRLDLMLHIGGFIDVLEGSARIDISPILPERLGIHDFGYQFGQVIAEIDWRNLT